MQSLASLPFSFAGGLTPEWDPNLSIEAGESIQSGEASPQLRGSNLWLAGMVGSITNQSNPFVNERSISSFGDSKPATEAKPD